jgi:hypothetical protein
LGVAALIDWSRRYILFHDKRHPRELGLPEIGQFLESLARTDKDPVRAIAAGRDALEAADCTDPHPGPPPRA